MLFRDAYWQRRAWAAWSTGLVARGAVTELDQLLPRDPVRERARQAEATAHALAVMRAQLGLKSEFVPY